MPLLISDHSALPLTQKFCQKPSRCYWNNIMTSHSCYSQFQGRQGHTPLDMEIFGFFSSLSTVTNPTSDSGLVSKGAQCCSLEMRAEDTSQNLSFHLSNSSLYHEQPRADHIVQDKKKKEE